MPNCRDQGAGFDVSGHNGRAAFATLANSLASIQQQFALQIVCRERGRGVALVAMLSKDRADFRLKEVDSLGSRFLVRPGS